MAVLPPPSVPSSSSDQTLVSNPSNTATTKGCLKEEAVDVPEAKPEVGENSQNMDTTAQTEKYKRYEADYVKRIKAKYFSKKNLYGGNIFDKETEIENEIIKSSRWPCTRSFTDPVQSFEDCSRSSASAEETSSNLANRKKPV